MSLGAILAAVFTDTALQAQVQTPVEEADADQPIALDPVKVTARKREEDIRDVPFGISVVGSEEIERNRVTDNRALGRRIGNLNFIESGVRGFNRLNIRGVGDIGGGFAPDDNSVGYFLDGVPLPLLAIDGDLLGGEQVEVLRGPQNVLFGRNAQGGAINVRTADPADEPEFSLAAEAGNLEQRKVTATASGPLGAGLGGRLALQYRGRDGDVSNDLGGDVRDIDVANVLGKLKADIGEDTDAELLLRYEFQDEAVLLRAFVEDPAFPRVRLDVEPEQETENLVTGLTLDHDLGAATLTSSTSFYYGDYRFLNDQSDGRLFSAVTGLPPESFDDSSVDFATQDTNEIRLNQELRLAGEVGILDWLLGGNAFYSDYENDSVFNLAGLFAGTFDSEIETQSYGGFGGVTLHVTDTLRLGAELRYTYEREAFEGGFVSEPGASPVASNRQNLSDTFDFFTGRVSLSYDLFEEATVYATVARGAKAGGFSSLDTDLAIVPGISVDSFNTARTTSYEVGARGDLSNSRIRYGLSAFFNETKDEQLSAFDFATFTARLENADTETYGGELEVTARPTDDLTLRAAVGVLRTEITSADPDTGADVGGDVPNAPEISFSIGAQYVQPLDGLGLSADLVIGGEYQYVGSQEADIGNTRSLDAYDIINLRLGIVAENLEVYAFADNLLDETYALGAFPFEAPGSEQVSVGGVGQPRLFGVGAKVRF